MPTNFNAASESYEVYRYDSRPHLTQYVKPNHTEDHVPARSNNIRFLLLTDIDCFLTIPLGPVAPTLVTLKAKFSSVANQRNASMPLIENDSFKRRLI